VIAVVLDASPIGLLCHPRKSPNAVACRKWVDDLLQAHRRVILPEIGDYETRRELIRNGNVKGVGILDQLPLKLEYLPLTSAHLRHAAKMWAQARNAGKPTAPKEALDADVILAAQALSLNMQVIVATENIGHLAPFVAADSWRNIRP
jgi:predicted nucleic acid-binding protein